MQSSWTQTLHGVNCMVGSSLAGLFGKGLEEDTSVSDRLGSRHTLRPPSVSFLPSGSLHSSPALSCASMSRRVICDVDEKDEDEADEQGREEEEGMSISPAPATATVLAIAPVTVSDGLQYRDDDPAFNSVLQRMRRIEEAVGLPEPGSGARQMHNSVPLSEFKLQVKDHSHCPTTGRSFVPGGAAKATKCTKTNAGGFPHVIREVPEEEGGGTVYHVITNKNVMITASVYRTDSGEIRKPESVLVERANQLLRTELETKGEYPLTELRMKMRLVAAHISHTHPGADPIGLGPHRWWDNDLNTEIEGQRDKPQLLIPWERTEAYTRAVLSGRVSYSFKIRPGVSSPLCRAHKDCHFRIVVEPESEVLRKRCANLTALTEHFWVSAKYNAGKSEVAV